jgi:hypothetical protein
LSEQALGKNMTIQDPFPRPQPLPELPKNLRLQSDGYQTLKLWNPLDYLRLLYFIFFNPLSFTEQIKISWKLILQGIIIAIIMPAISIYTQNNIRGVSTNYIGLAQTIFIIVSLSVFFTMQGLEFAIAFSVTYGISFALMFWIIANSAHLVAFGVALVIAFGIKERSWGGGFWGFVWGIVF